MSKTRKHNDKYPRDGASGPARGSRRRISIRAVRRTDPDLRRMGRALIEFTLAQAEAEAAAKADTAPEPEGTPEHLDD